MEKSVFFLFSEHHVNRSPGAVVAGLQQYNRFFTDGFLFFFGQPVGDVGIVIGTLAVVSAEAERLFKMVVRFDTIIANAVRGTVCSHGKVDLHIAFPFYEFLQICTVRAEFVQVMVALATGADKTVIIGIVRQLVILHAGVHIGIHIGRAV